MRRRRLFRFPLTAVLRVTLLGLVAPFSGGLILLYGQRKLLTGSAALLIGGMLFAIVMTAKWQLWLSLGIIPGVAPGLTDTLGLPLSRFRRPSAITKVHPHKALRDRVKPASRAQRGCAKRLA